MANKLSLNVAKTEFMLIGPKRMKTGSSLNILIENKQIKQVNECKSLGILIDQHLSWNNNTKNICKKVTAGISALRRVKPFVNKETLISIYTAIIRPHFDYCCEVWDVLGKTQSDRLQKLQNRAARVIMSMSNDTDQSTVLQALGWEPLNIMRRKAKAKLMYKVLNKMAPEPLTKLFKYKNEITNHKLRNISTSLSVPQPRTNNMKNSFMYDGAHLWNSIPNEVKECKTLSLFRNKIATHIF